eukprot:9063147-Karenia_brevis.AAC.1
MKRYPWNFDDTPLVAFKIAHHDNPKVKNKLLTSICPDQPETNQVHDDTDSECEETEPESDS